MKNLNGKTQDLIKPDFILILEKSFLGKPEIGFLGENVFVSLKKTNFWIFSDLILKSTKVHPNATRETTELRPPSVRKLSRFDELL